MGRPYLEAAHRLGLRVHAIEASGRAAALEGVVEHLTVTRGDSDESWVAAAAAAAAARRPDGVVAFSEPQALAAALIATEHSLPGASLRATILSRNKALQRGCFAAVGIRQPDYLIAPSLADAAAADWAREHFPVVLKPLSASGSLGVEAVSDESGYAGAVRRRNGQTLLVERMVEGLEYSWEALVRDGEIWTANLTAKQTSGPPGFIETGHRLGCPVDHGLAAAAHKLGVAVVAALGMGSGIVHMEFRADAEGPVFMEVAVRTPGDFLMDLLGVVDGVDWFEMVVRLAMGMELPEPPRGPLVCAAAHIPVSEPGLIVAIDGLEAVRAHPGVLRADVYAAVGDEVPVARSSADRRIVVLASAPDPAALEEALAFADRTLRIRTRPNSAAATPDGGG